MVCDCNTSLCASAAFYEQSQLTLKQNKDVVDELRREGKELRSALANMNKERGGTEMSAIHEAELTKVEQALTLLRQRQNQVMCGNKAKEKTLRILEDELKDLQRSSSRPAHEANPLVEEYGHRTRAACAFAADSPAAHRDLARGAVAASRCGRFGPSRTGWTRR